MIRFRNSYRILPRNRTLALLFGSYVALRLSWMEVFNFYSGNISRRASYAGCRRLSGLFPVGTSIRILFIPIWNGEKFKTFRREMRRGHAGMYSLLCFARFLTILWLNVFTKTYIKSFAVYLILIEERGWCFSIIEQKGAFSNRCCEGDTIKVPKIECRKRFGNILRQGLDDSK